MPFAPRSSDTLDPSPRGLGDEDLPLLLTDGVPRGILASLSSFSCSRPGGITRAFLAGIIPGSLPGGIICVAAAGLDFDIRPDGVLCAASAGLLLGIGPRGHCCAALAGIVPTLLRSGLLGQLAPRATAS